MSVRTDKETKIIRTENTMKYINELISVDKGLYKSSAFNLKTIDIYIKNKLKALLNKKATERSDYND